MKGKIQSSLFSNVPELIVSNIHISVIKIRVVTVCIRAGLKFCRLAQNLRGNLNQLELSLHIFFYLIIFMKNQIIIFVYIICMQQDNRMTTAVVYDSPNL